MTMNSKSRIRFNAATATITRLMRMPIGPVLWMNGTFQPNKILNRAEGVAILARYAMLEESAGAPQFPDLKAGFWANQYIGAAKQAGMLAYLEGKDFKPDAPFTRAEACEVLYRVPAIQKKANEYWETGLISAGR